MINNELLDLELAKMSITSDMDNITGSYEVPDDLFGDSELDRAAELKKKELFRKGKLEYEDNGELIHDSNAMIRAKEVANAGLSAVDWALEATQNIGDFGQGDWLNNSQFKAENQGREYNMGNKDFVAARDTNLDDMILQYQNAEDNPNADKGIYTLRKFDGFNPDGTDRYIYKYGLAESGASDRYKNQYVQDGFEIVEEKRFTGAEDWENTFHALQSSLDSRVLDSGYVEDVNGKFTSRDKASGINFGSGSTELYNRDLLGTDFGKTEQDYAQNKATSDYMMEQDADRPKDSDWRDALQSSSVSMLGGLGDLFVNKIGNLDNKFLEKWSDSEYTDKYFGFDSKQQSQELEESLAALKNGDITSSFKNLAKASPGLLAQSMPYMLSMFVGSGEVAAGAKAIQIATRANKMAKAGKSVADVLKFTERGAKALGPHVVKKVAAYKDMPNILRKADAYIKTPLLAQSGFLAQHSANVDMQLNDRIAAKKEAGEDPTLSGGEIASVWAFMLPFAYLDKLAFTDSIKATGAAGMLKKAFTMAPDKVKTNIVTKVVTNAGKVIGSAGEEAGQEYLQTWGEIISKNYGISGQDTLMDVLSNKQNQKESQLGALGGFGAGGLTAGGANAGIGVKNYFADKKNQQPDTTTDTTEESTIANDPFVSNQEPVTPQATGSMNQAINIPEPDAETAPIEFYKNSIENELAVQKELANNKPDKADLLRSESLIRKAKYEIAATELSIQESTGEIPKGVHTKLKSMKRQLQGQIKIRDSLLNKYGTTSKATGSNQSEIDKVIESIVPRSKSDKNNVYKNSELTDELVLLEEKGTVPYTKHLDAISNEMKKFGDNYDAMPPEQIKRLQLGTSSAYIARVQETINKLYQNKTELTKKEQAIINDSEESIANLQKKVGETFQSLVNLYSQEELDAMNADETVKIFGAQINSDQAPYTSEISTDGTIPEQKVDTQETLNKENATFKKVETIQKNIGDTAGAQKTNARRKANVKKQQTLKSVKYDTFHGEEGLVPDIMKAIESNTIDENNIQDIANTINFTKNYLAKSSNKEPNQITDADIKTFLTKKDGESANDKKARSVYYGILQSQGLTSLFDLSAKSKKVKTAYTKSIKAVTDKTKQRKKKNKELNSIIKKAITDIQIEYRDYIKNGLPVKEENVNQTEINMDEDLPFNVRKEATKEQVIEYLKNKYEDKVILPDLNIIPGKDGKQFKIHYKDILIKAFDNKITGALKLMDDIDSEIIMLESFITKDGKLFIPEEQVKEQEKVDTKNQETKNAEEIKENEKLLKFTEGKETKVLNYDQIKENEKLLKEAKAKLKKQAQRINQHQKKVKKTISNKDFTITGSEDIVIDEVSSMLQDVGESITELEKIQISLVKTFNQQEKINLYSSAMKSIEKSIETAENQRAELYKSKDQLLSNMNEKQIRENKEEMTEEEWKVHQKKNRNTVVKNLIKAYYGIRNLFTNAQEYIKSLFGLTTKIEKLNERILKLETDKVQIEKAKDLEVQNLQKDLNVKVSNKSDITYKNVLEKNRIKRKSAKQHSRLLIKVINRLKSKTTIPIESAKALDVQEKAAISRINKSKDKNRYDENGISKIIGDYVETNSQAGNILQTLKVGEIDNPVIKKYIKKATKQLEEVINASNNIGVQSMMDTSQPVNAMILNEDGSLNENQAVAISLAIDTYLRNSLSRTFFKDKEAVAKMLGKHESDIDAKEMRVFRHKARRYIVANELAQSIFDILGYKAKKDGDIVAFARFKASYGSAAVSIMLKKLGGDNILEDASMSMNEYNKAIGMTADEIKAETVKNKNKNENPKTNFVTLPKKNNKFVLPSSKELEQIKKDLLELKEIGVAEIDTFGVSFTEPKKVSKKDVKVRGNKHANVAKEVTDAINKLEHQKQVLNLDGMNLVKEYGKDKILKSMGYIDDDIVDKDDSLSEESKEAQKSKNQEVLREYQALMDLTELIESGSESNEFYLKYFSPNNNRINEDGGGISEQNNKELQRWLMGPELHTQKYNLDDIKNTDENSAGFEKAIGFRFGIAQAFGFKTDGKNVSETIAYSNTILNKTIPELEKMIKEEKFDHIGHALQALQAIKIYKAYEVKTNLYKKIGKTYYEPLVMTITAEYDGKTNGAFLKTMQMPIQDNTDELMLKYGIVIDNGKSNAGENQLGVSFDKFDGLLYTKKDEVLDVYLTNATISELEDDKVVARIESHKKEDKNGNEYNVANQYDLSLSDLKNFIPTKDDILNNKDIRDLFKYPTLIIQYGGKLTSVRKAVGFDSTTSMIDQLLEMDNTGSETEKALSHLILEKIIAKEITIPYNNKFPKTVPLLLEALRTRSLDQIGHVEQNLNKMFEVAVGEAVTDAINETFGEIIEKTIQINKMTHSSFRIFEEVLTNEIVKYKETKKLNDSDKISPEEMEKIITSIKHFLPSFEGPSGEAREQSGVYPIDSKLTTDDETKSGSDKAGVKTLSTEDMNANKEIFKNSKKGDNPKYRNPTNLVSRAFIKKLAESYAGAGVLPIHTLDGYNMALNINQLIADYGIIAVHDAIIIGGISVSGALQNVNKNFIETNEQYDMVNAIAEASRAVYEAARQYEIDNSGFKIATLNETRNENEQKAVKKGLAEEEVYKPQTYQEQLVSFEDMSEIVWSDKADIFSNKIKIDQMPGPISMYQYNPKYRAKKYIKEFTKRITLRLEFMDEQTKGIFGSKMNIDKFVTSLLNVNNIKKSSKQKTISEEQKIKYNLDIINEFTKILNGVC